MRKGKQTNSIGIEKQNYKNLISYDFLNKYLELVN